MTHGVPLTSKEAGALLQLSQYLTRAENLGLTDDELNTLEAKLRNGPKLAEEFQKRLIEAAQACRSVGEFRSARLDVVESGVRVHVTDVQTGRHRTRICAWIAIATCRVNPLLLHLKGALEDLDR